MELSNTHRLLSAGLGACLTSLVVTPFDVVKTRLQAQINSVNGGSGGAGGAAAAAAPRRPTASQELLRNCSHYRLHTGLTDQWCANCFSFSRRQPEPALSWRPQAGRAPPKPEDLRFSGAIDAAMKLVKHEGAASLWRGLSPTLLMSIPSTVVYFSVYDKTKIAMAALTPEYVAKHHAEWLAPHTGTLQTLSPLLSGVFARALTTTLVSPIELVRTKSQSLRTSSTMRALLSEEMQRGGFFFAVARRRSHSDARRSLLRHLLDLLRVQQVVDADALGRGGGQARRGGRSRRRAGTRARGEEQDDLRVVPRGGRQWHA